MKADKQPKKAGKEQKESPLFSIIVPAYNNERELNRCIDSILDQSCRDFELILVDDGSADRTPVICDGYAEKDSRVKVIHKENQGAAAARNDGLFAARGCYIYYADADDWIEPGLLEEAFRALQTPEPPQLFIFGYERLALEQEEPISCSWPLEPGLYSKERLEREVYPRMMDSFAAAKGQRLVSPGLCDKIIRKELLLEHYCRDTSLFYQEDFVCSYECVYFAERIYFSPMDFYVYNQRSQSSMHRRYHRDLLKNNRAAAQYLRTHLGGRGNRDMDRQIQELEFDGLITAACQELRFSRSIWQAAGRFKKLLKQDADFPVCSMENLSFPAKCCIWMMSQGVVFPSLLVIKVLCRIKGISITEG